MFKLTMTTHSRDERPPIISEKLEDITNLHSFHMIGESIENQKPSNDRELSRTPERVAGKAVF
jgi:hypothetical protein